MMLKNRTSISKSGGVNSLLLTVIVLLMIAGAVAGSVFASKISGQEEWVVDYLSNSRADAFKSGVICNLAIVGVIFISGFVPIGLIVIAAATAAKGFIASCTVTACVKLLGIKGYITAFQTGFISLVFSTFAVAFIAMQGVRNAGRGIKGKGQSQDDKGDYFTSFMIAVALTIFGGAVNAFLLK